MILLMLKGDATNAQWGFGLIWKHIHVYNMDAMKHDNSK
jgi:hypothetical protein